MGYGNQITEQQHGASASPVIESLLLPLLMPPPLLLLPLLLLLPPLLPLPLLLLLLPPLLLLLRNKHPIGTASAAAETVDIGSHSWRRGVRRPSVWGR